MVLIYGWWGRERGIENFVRLPEGIDKRKKVWKELDKSLTTNVLSFSDTKPTISSNIEDRTLVVKWLCSRIPAPVFETPLPHPIGILPITSSLR